MESEHKILCLVTLALAGFGGWKLYDMATSNDNDDIGAEGDDYWAGLNFGITGWLPQLPIHPRSKVPTQGVYAAPKISNKRGTAGTMVPARTTDYANPSQFVPTTGPGNLAPILGVNTGFVNADLNGLSSAVGYTEELYVLNDAQAGALIAGPLPPIADSTGYKLPVGTHYEADVMASYAPLATLDSSPGVNTVPGAPNGAAFNPPVGAFYEQG